MTLLVSIAGLAIGAVFGSLVAWAKLSGAGVAGALGEAYAALFRGLPELLVIYFVYFGSSALLTGIGTGSASKVFWACRRSPPARSPSA